MSNGFDLDRQHQLNELRVGGPAVLEIKTYESAPIFAGVNFRQMVIDFLPEWARIQRERESEAPCTN